MLPSCHQSESPYKNNSFRTKLQLQYISPRFTAPTVEAHPTTLNSHPLPPHPSPRPPLHRPPPPHLRRDTSRGCGRRPVTGSRCCWGSAGVSPWQVSADTR